MFIFEYRNKHKKMKNYIVTLFVKTSKSSQEKMFSMVVKGKSNYLNKAKDILFDYSKASFYVTCHFIEEETNLEDGTMIITSRI